MKTITFLPAGFMLLLSIGCSHTIPGGLNDATAPVPQQQYQVLGESEGSVSSTFVFGIQTNKPDIEIALRKAIAKLDGDELVNVSWYHKNSFYFLFSKYTFIVRGTVIKRIKEGLPITSIRPYPSQKYDSPVKISGLGFTLSYSRGTFNEFGFYTDESISGFSGLRLKFNLKDKDALFFFYPEISYSKLSKKDKIKEEYGGRIYEFEFDGFIRTIPITLNVGINGSKIEQLAQNLPPELNPYANIGIGYYLTDFGGGDWEWTQFGYNFGLGAEYRLQPNLSLGVGFNRHSVFTGETYTFWDWNLGLSYYLNK